MFQWSIGMAFFISINKLLTRKGLRLFFCQKPLKTTFSAAFIQENKNKKHFFLESNHRILYLTYLRSCGKNFMKFDRIDWKI